MKLRIYGFKDYLFEDVATLGAKSNALVDRICALLMALCPIIQFYVGIYQNAAFTVIIALFPLIALRFVRISSHGGFDKRCMGAVIPIILFQVFKMFDHTISINKTLYGIFFIVLFMAIAAGCINARLFLKYATAVSVLAAILLVVQYFCYYVLGFHLQLAPTSLFLPSSSGWVLGVQTGLHGLRGIKNGFYRPCAFFMEPSHLFLYTFPTLCAVLFSPGKTRWRIRCSLLITLGILLSTSGMGILAAAALWAVYIALYHSKNNEKNVARLKNLLSAKNLIILLAAMALAVILYFNVPVFTQTVNRFLVRGSTGQSTAVAGRTRLAQMLVSSMSGKSLLIGVAENLDEVNFNMPGFFATLYKYGVIGVVLSYWYYAQYLFRTKDAGFWMSILILVVSFFSAHTHGTFYMMYYILVLVNAHYMSVRGKSIENRGETV